MIQNSLGDTLRILGERERGTEHLEASVAAYRDALKELTRERAPLGWARTQYSIGCALGILGDRQSGTQQLKESVRAIELARGVYREANLVEQEGDFEAILLLLNELIAQRLSHRAESA
jgi:hypothetical protein